MRSLPYEEMDKLTPCPVCGSRRYWFDGEVWQCRNCVPPPSEGVIRVNLKPRLN
jgi:ribosomal protein L37AE/L43A